MAIKKSPYNVSHMHPVFQQFVGGPSYSSTASNNQTHTGSHLPSHTVHGGPAPIRKPGFWSKLF